MNLDVVKFNIEKGGIVCKNCFYKDSHCEDMDLNMYKAMKLLLYTPLDEVIYLKYLKVLRLNYMLLWKIHIK